MMTPEREDSTENSLQGEVVKEVREATKWDLILEFESGKVLRVYDAKWHVEAEGDNG